MPLIKTKHEDIITTEQWTKLLNLAAKLDFEKTRRAPPYKLWMQATLAIDWLTGKRINEILSLKRKHFSFEDKMIKILFFVGKKKARSSPLEQLPYQKTRTIDHQAVPYILAYLDEYDRVNKSKEGYLFPAQTQQQYRVVHTTFLNGQGEKETREYEYTLPGGYVYEQTARYWLSKINKQLPENERIYFHWGRHTIGIKMARQGRSAWQIGEVLDDTERAATEYTKKAGGYAQEWTKETE